MLAATTGVVALFYLRSVAAKEPYKDRVTGAMTEPVTTGQIYWGAVPFVVIQCVMVGLVIAFPAMVMRTADRSKQDQNRDPNADTSGHSWGVGRAPDTIAATYPWCRGASTSYYAGAFPDGHTATTCARCGASVGYAPASG